MTKDKASTDSDTMVLSSVCGLFASVFASMFASVFASA